MVSQNPKPLLIYLWPMEVTESMMDLEAPVGFYFFFVLFGVYVLEKEFYSRTHGAHQRDRKR